MKKLLGILVLVFWCNVSVGKSINEEKCEKNPDDPFCKAERKKAFVAQKSLNDYLNEGYKITSEELVKGQNWIITIFILKKRGSIVTCTVDHLARRTSCRKP